MYALFVQVLFRPLSIIQYKTQPHLQISCYCISVPSPYTVAVQWCLVPTDLAVTSIRQLLDRVQCTSPHSVWRRSDSIPCTCATIHPVNHPSHLLISNTRSRVHTYSHVDHLWQMCRTFPLWLCPAQQLKQQLCSTLVAAQWRGDTILTLPLF